MQHRIRDIQPAPAFHQAHRPAAVRMHQRIRRPVPDQVRGQSSQMCVLRVRSRRSLHHPVQQPARRSSRRKWTLAAVQHRIHGIQLPVRFQVPVLALPEVQADPDYKSRRMYPAQEQCRQPVQAGHKIRRTVQEQVPGSAQASVPATVPASEAGMQRVQVQAAEQIRSDPQERVPAEPAARVRRNSPVRVQRV